MTEYNGLHKKENMIGFKFGEWEVLGYSHQQKKSGNWYYVCKCSCGNTSKVCGSLLRTGKSKKCKSCSSKINGRKGIYAQAKGDLYMIRVNDYVKIGISKDVNRRVKDIQSSCPYKPELIYHGIGEAKDEEMWHTVFKHRHHIGEWFFMPTTACEIR